MVWSVAGAVVVLVIVVLLGPEREEVKRRFEFPGAEGPLKIMPEISITPGRDRVEQLPEYFRKTPPLPTVEIQPDEIDPDAQQEIPPQDVFQPEIATETELQVETNPDLKEVNLVEFSLPQQTNPDFVLIRMIRPQYPAHATEAQRRTPVIKVEAAIYIEVTGEVTASMILSSNGGQVFDEVVLQAVNQWLYRPIIKDGKPPQARWQTLTWRFWSPYLDNR